ncbi:MAG: hypothetical protein H6Q13_3109 [Bacteroidetes bacterium]|jgi:hypothetical protein|nr:hypothetical protein [Bacteroidota bacterium]
MNLDTIHSLCIQILIKQILKEYEPSSSYLKREVSTSCLFFSL